MTAPIASPTRAMDGFVMLKRGHPFSATPTRAVDGWRRLT